MNLEGFKSTTYQFTCDERITGLYIANRDDGYKAFPILKDFVANIWDSHEEGEIGVTSTIKWYIIPVDDNETNEKFGRESEIDVCEHPLKAIDGNWYYVYHVGGDTHQNTGHFPYEPR